MGCGGGTESPGQSYLDLNFFPYEDICLSDRDNELFIVEEMGYSRRICLKG